MFIAREKEVEMLRLAALSDESKFVAVYGRRRIGKTYLIRETFGDAFMFRHTGYYNRPAKEQLYAFCSSLREAGLEDFEIPRNWLEAFELLKVLVRKSAREKKIIFIDELSWMDSGHGDLISALEGFWNGWASARKDILLIVCTSSTSWMLDKIVHNKGGLYNRLSLRINLKPFTLRECEEYVNAHDLAFDRQSILECYMIMGGIPYYWSLLKRGKSLYQNIDLVFFAEDAPLKDEFRYLYQAIFKKPEHYITIISTLAKKKVGMARNELIEKTGLANSGNLSSKLDELESCGFIRKYRGYNKSKRDALYQLMDNFTLFYYRFMKDEPTDEGFWSKRINTPEYNTWCGLSFERVCLQHIPEIKKALGISGVITECYSFRCNEDVEKGVNGSQIDLLLERGDHVVNLCEMKYCTEKFTVTKSVDSNLRKKVADFVTVTKSKSAIHPTLVTTYGIKDNSYRHYIQSVITMDDLFERT